MHSVMCAVGWDAVYLAIVWTFAIGRARVKKTHVCQIGRLAKLEVFVAVESTALEPLVWFQWARSPAPAGLRASFSPG